MMFLMLFCRSAFFLFFPSSIHRPEISVFFDACCIIPPEGSISCLPPHYVFVLVHSENMDAHNLHHAWCALWGARQECYSSSACYTAIAIRGMLFTEWCSAIKILLLLILFLGCFAFQPIILKVTCFYFRNPFYFLI